MGKMRSLFRKEVFSLVFVASAGLTLCACAALDVVSENQAAIEKAKAPVIQAINVTPSQEQTVVEFVSSEPVFYTAFKLLDPPRVVLDIRGVPGSALPRVKDVNSAGVKDILIEEGKAQMMTTRAVVNTTLPVLYQTEPKGNVIALTLTPEKPLPVAGELPEKKTAAVEGASTSASEPRIFFKDTPGPLTQILGVDFTLLEHGKSRLIVTTDKKTKYDLNQQGPKTLVLKVPEATIPPLIMRHMDSKHFEGAVDWVKASLSQKDVAIAITLREMVPFHVKQTDSAITIDFGPTAIKPLEKKIVPLQPAAAQAPVVQAPVVQATASGPVISLQQKTDQPGTLGTQPGLPFVASGAIPGMKKDYKGAPMTMDFVNADVTNILRLIGEVSNLNIVWGPEVKGIVSMRLKDVPWDQALDLILDNNNLAKREQGNVVWVTTKAAMSQIEAEERRKRQEYEAEVQKQIEAKRKAAEIAVALEPLQTEYIHINFGVAKEIAGHLQPYRSERGKITATETLNGKNPGKNMLIVTETPTKLKEIKEVISHFDTPSKQIMIEARIVDASDNFARDLGIKWDQFQVQRRSDTTIPWTANSGLNTTPGDPSAFPVPPAGKNYSPTFTSNAPDGWTPNLGLVFSTLSASGLTALVLDAKLALAESEGKSKTIAAPKVIAMNGEEAEIKRGEEQTILPTENVAAVPFSAELSLKVTPTVSYNDFVTLTVEVKDDKPVGTLRKATKNIKTRLMVKSGDTVVIGGIFNQDELEDEAGIPGLRRLPILGWLFKAQRITNTKTELLIFLTPSVVASTFKS